MICVFKMVCVNMKYFEIHTNFSVDLHTEDILRLRTGKLYGGVGRIFQPEDFWVTYLFGHLVSTHAAVGLVGLPADDDDGFRIGDHGHHSAT